MDARRTEEVRLSLPGGGELQTYLSHPGRDLDWAVLFIHGFGSTRGGEKARAVEAACDRRSWAFASFDFRGHGGSSGTLIELSGSGLLDDLETVRDQLAVWGLRRLCLVGSSMGGWAAAWFTLRHPDAVPACALIAPSFDFIRHRWSQLSDAERQGWRQTGRLRVRNQWLDVEIGYHLVEEGDQFPLGVLTAEWSRPLLIFHGLRDETIPFAHSLAFLQDASGPDVELRVYKDGDHRLLPWKDEMAEAACDFFARRVPAAPG